jgi:hypothetical protein
MKPLTLDRALADRHLLGAGLGPLASWSTWITVLKAALDRDLDAAELDVFRSVAGDRFPPAHRVRELWAVCGRRSGKSRMAAAVAVYLALFTKHRLAPGETGMALVIAGTQEQAGVVFGYVRGFLEAAPALRHEVVAWRAREVELRNGIVIGVHANSYRSVRGRTLIAAVFDECSFWRDETSAQPDTEVYTAVLPSLATTGGMLIGISTPYRKAGLLYQKWRDHYADVDNDDVLVVQGASQRFNPTLSDDVVEAQREADPLAAGAEWDAIFRDDLSSFLDEQSIDAAVDHGRPLELSPREGVMYFAFVDMSGGRHDLSTLAIVHIEDADGERRFVADVIRGRKGDPNAAVVEFVELAKCYRCTTIAGDNYAAEWVAGAYREAGVEYMRSPLVRSELYLAGLPLFTRGVVQIANQAPLLRELRLLERRTARSGRDVVDHGAGCSDDFANALFGALYLAACVPVYVEPPVVVPYVAGVPRGIPGGSVYGGGSGEPRTDYDYNRETSWRDYVNGDGSIRSRPRGPWDY